MGQSCGGPSLLTHLGKSEHGNSREWLLPHAVSLPLGNNTGSLLLTFLMFQELNEGELLL